MKKLITYLVFLHISSCASIKYPNWELVRIEPSVLGKPCEIKLSAAEYCKNDNCDDWYKKRATIYKANTVVKHNNDYASYFYCASGLPPYKNQDSKIAKKAIDENIPEKCVPNHDEKYLKNSYVNIKGYYIGMERCEIEVTLKNSYSEFTIVGINVDKPTLKFTNEKLTSLYVEIPSDTFHRLQSGIQSKYPETKCKNSIIHNRMNASFEQTECILSFEKGKLILSKYNTDTTKSSIYLISNEELHKSMILEQEKEKDI